MATVRQIWAARAEWPAACLTLNGIRTLATPNPLRPATLDRVMRVRALLFRAVVGAFVGLSNYELAAQLPGPAKEPPRKAAEESPAAAAVPLPTPAKVDVDPQAADADIGERLGRIMVATEWFEQPRAEVKEGVVFLYGTTSTQRYKDWAGDLARNTQDVAAVVNRIAVRESSVWDLAPVRAEVEAMWRRTMVAMPYILLGLLIMSLSYAAAKLETNVSRRFFERRFDTPLLREVLARGTGAVIFLLGLYFVLRIYGLTRLAATVLGGTGLVGLVLGIAFRDITENFLASIFLSMQPVSHWRPRADRDGRWVCQAPQCPDHGPDDAGWELCADSKRDGLQNPDRQLHEQSESP
jgi:small conductance mechanosensitive channel